MSAGSPTVRLSPLWAVPATEPSGPRASARCRLGMHDYATVVNDDGGRYLVCTRCGKESFPPASAGPRISLFDAVVWCRRSLVPVPVMG